MTRPDPPYTRIVSEIRRRIGAGELRAGERVPSTRQISQEWGVAIATATKVLTALRQEGLVRAIPGVGTVVNPAEPASEPAREAVHGPVAVPGGNTLTRQRIVAAAISVADREGLGALSMRRVANELGAATMSLYRHVQNKDELVLLMLDAVFAEVTLPDPPPPGWRERIDLVARLQWATFRRHPWLARVISFTRPVPAPHAMAHTELAMSALDGLGFDPITALYLIVAVTGHVLATAVNLESEFEALQNTGVTPDEWMRAYEPKMAEAAVLERFPRLLAVGLEPDFDMDLDTVFEIGLELVLDGLAARIERGQVPASPAARHEPRGPR
jgi:AcrR family transcriptional regulator